MSKRTIIEKVKNYKTLYIEGVDKLRKPAEAGIYTPEHIEDLKRQVVAEYAPKLDALRDEIIKDAEDTGKAISDKQGSAAADLAGVLHEALGMIEAGAMDKDIVKVYSERLQSAPAMLKVFRRALAKSKDDNIRALSVLVTLRAAAHEEVCETIMNRAIYLPQIHKESGEHLGGLDAASLYHAGIAFDNLVNYIDQALEE